MLFAIIVLTYFLTIQQISYYVDLRSEKYFQYFVVLLSFIILDLLRVYCQAYFPDIPNYQQVFDETPSIYNFIKGGYGIEYFDNVVELGFSFFISFFKNFSNSYSLFLFLISVIELVCFYYFCRKFQINLVNSIPIYLAFTFLTFQIGMLRQALAFCFFLFALININKKAIFFALIVVGVTLHTSILFCLVFFWVDRYVNRKIFYAIFLLSLLLYLFKIDLIGTYLPILQLGDSIRTAKVGYYLNVDRPNSFLGIGFWERIVSFILLNVIYSKLSFYNKITKYNNIIYNLGIVVILLQMIFFSSPTITSRLRYYIVIFPALFISEYIFSDIEDDFKWIYQLLFSLYLYMYLFLLATYLIE